VVRAVANSPVPIICGVGHETDFTLSDFAADLRAPTPTAAAELATPITLLDLLASMESYRNRLSSVTMGLLADQQNILSSLTAALRYASPERRILSERQRVDELARRAHASLLHRLQLQSTHIRGMERRLEALNPMAVLARGYAVVTRKEDGSVVSRVAQARPGEPIQIRLADGQVDAEIKNHKS
jgi:exodeoxyribonuclease VII large subunit